MVDSKVSLGLIFFSPFLILLIISSAYIGHDSLNLDIGLVLSLESSFSDKFIDRLDEHDFNTIIFRSNDKCAERLKQNKVNICIETTSQGDKPMLEFTVDYSELNLVNRMIDILSQNIENQKQDLRGVLLEKMGERINDFSDLLKGQKSSLGIPDVKISNSDLSENAISDMRRSLGGLESNIGQVTFSMNSKMESFKQDLKDVKKKANNQRSTIRDLRNYNKDCDSKYQEELEGITPEMDPEEAERRIEKYGKCKCVEFYSPSLERIDEDLESVVGDVDNAMTELGSAQRQNSDFENSFSQEINDISPQFDEASKMNRMMNQEITSLQQNLNSKFEDIEDFIAQAETFANDLSGSMLLSSDIIQNPVIININPVSRERELIVYMFPIIYFLILIFVSLLFSSSFSFNETHSAAFNRNNLSPISYFTHYTSILISVLFLILVQAVFLIFLGNIAFGLDFNLSMAIKLMLLTLLTMSFFILIGISLGSFSKSQLVTILSSIGISIVMFLYSNVIRPEEMMTQFARALSSLNPYLLGSETARQILLFDGNLSLINIVVIGLEVILAGLLLMLFHFWHRH